MALEWIQDAPPVWDDLKKKLVADAPDGVFDTRYRDLEPGSRAPCEWWRVEDAGTVLGFGWMDVVWGDAEILLVTTADGRGKGVGTFILDRLEEEAGKRGLSYLYNIVRPTHPDADTVSAWLQKRGFTTSADGRLLRRVGAAKA